MVATSVFSKDLECFKNIHPRFSEAFEFLKKAVNEDYKDGNYEIDGKNIFAFISSYETKTESKVQFEAHNKYIDIQCVISGTEVIGFESEKETTLTQDYKDGNDICFYALNENYDKIVLNNGEFVIIMADELHAPCLSIKNIPQQVKKIVVKVLK
ncbi:MAG: YhcH/YjgK/YiaL family protein [Clostridia bacterium]|nr:YhcH/YjgK/YiaL family protein [Clostridia bacterium]